MWIINAARNHRYAVIVSLCCAVGGFALGFLVAHSIPREPPPAGSVDQDKRTEKNGTPKSDPEAAPPVRKAPPSVALLTLYPGMPVENIERQITARIERWVSQADGVQRVESKSVTGLGVVKVHFHDNIDPNTAHAQVASLALADLYYLPPGTVPPIVMLYDRNAPFPVGYVVVSSDVLDETKLYELAYFNVRNMLQGVPGVVAPFVSGGKLRRIYVELDPVKLHAHQLSLTDVQKALGQGSPLIPTGRLRFGDDPGVPEHLQKKDLLLDLKSMAEKVEELEQIPVKSGQSVVYLKDVGQVADRGVIRTNACTRLNGRRQVCLPVYCRSGSDANAVREAVRKALPRMQERLPPLEGKTSAGVDLQFWPIGVNHGKATGPADTGLITIHLRAPSGTRLEDSEKVVAGVERSLEENIPPAERTLIVSELGLDLDLSAVFTQNSGPQDTTIRVQLSPARASTAQEYVRKLRRLFPERFPELQASFHAGPEAVAPIVIQIEGRDLKQGQRLSQEVRERVAKVAGTADVYVGERLDFPSVLIDVDREKAAQKGLSVEDVLREVAAAGTPGLTLSSSYWIDRTSGNHIFMGVRNAREAATRPEDLGKLPITGKHEAKPVPLADLANIRQTSTPVEIHHVNLARVFTVRVNIDGRDLRRVVSEIDKSLKELKVPDGIRIEIKSEQPHTNGSSK